MLSFLWCDPSILERFAHRSSIHGCPFSSDWVDSAATELVTRCIQVMHDAGCDEVLKIILQVPVLVTRFDPTSCV